jgi:hypothetical protein
VTSPTTEPTQTGGGTSVPSGGGPAGGGTGTGGAGGAAGTGGGLASGAAGQAQGQTAAQTETPAPGTPTPAAPTPTPATALTPTPTPITPASVQGPAKLFPSGRPELFTGIASVGDFLDDFDTGTVAANAVFSVILLLLLVDASIFNSTIKENEGEILGFFGGMAAPFHGLGAAWTAQQGIFGNFGKPLLVLGLSALVYCLLEPGLALDRSAIVLFLSLVAGIGVATYVYEGAQVLISERFFEMPSAIRFFPVAIAIAIGSVLLSRVTGLHPGLVYGFVAGAAIVAARDPDRREAGLIIFVPMLAMLAVALVAWALLGPLRALSDDDNFAALVLEGAAAAIFMGGVQGLLFALIPMSFMDGEKVWNWSKLAWVAITLPVAFLFFQVVLNQDGTLRSAFDSPGVSALIILAAVCWTITGITWLFFKIRSSASA